MNYKCGTCKSITMDLLSNLTTFSGVAISLTGVNITTPNKRTSLGTCKYLPVVCSCWYIYYKVF